MTPFTLENKTILITGASSGIGAETALTVANAGAKLILSGRDEAKLKSVLVSLPEGDHQIISADLADSEAIKALVEQVEVLDGVVHSAGIVRPFPVKFIGQKQIDEMFGINYEGPVLLTSQLFKAKKINHGASFVFMSSISSQFPHKGGALYAGSKAALNAFSKTIALEYATKKIRSTSSAQRWCGHPFLMKRKRQFLRRQWTNTVSIIHLGLENLRILQMQCSFCSLMGRNGSQELSW